MYKILNIQKNTNSGVKPSCSYHPALTSIFCQYCAKYLDFLFFWNNLKKVLDIVYVLCYINYAIIYFKCKYLLYSQIYEEIFLNFILFNFTILYWFCHTSKWICHRYTCVPHPEPSSLPIPSLWVVPVHQPQASRIVHRTWTGNSFHIWYYTYFNAILPNHPTLSLSQSPKDCSIHQCLFCCLVYRVIVTIFLNSIYMR